MDAIAAEGLEKRYGDVDGLAGVSFAVGQGEVFGLLGPNRVAGQRRKREAHGLAPRIADE